MPSRVLRGVVIAAVGLGMAAAGHSYGGGTFGPTPAGVLLLVLTGAACVLLSNRRWTPQRLAVALTCMQALTHAVRWFDAGGRVADPRLSLVTTADPAAHAHSLQAGLSWGMVLAHLVAVAAAAMLLAGLERAALSLRALAQRCRPRVVVVLSAAGVSLVRVPQLVGATGVVVLGDVGRRGPPAVLAPR